MLIDGYSTLLDKSSVKVIFVRTPETDLSVFNNAIKQIQNTIGRRTKINDNLYSFYSKIYENCSEEKSEPHSINFLFKVIRFLNAEKSITKYSKTENSVIITISDKKKVRSQNCTYENSEIQPSKCLLLYNVEINYPFGFENEPECYCRNIDSNGIITINRLAENIVYEILNKINSILETNIQENAYISLKGESIDEQLILNRKIQIAEIYLIIGLPVLSALLYNSIICSIEDCDSNFWCHLANSIEGQASVLFYYYCHSKYPIEWWEAVSNSPNSFIQELPVPLQESAQFIQPVLHNLPETTLQAQSRKTVIFDIILKKLSLSFNFLAKLNHCINGFPFSNYSKLAQSDYLIPMLELVIKKSRFIAENLVSHFQMDRKIVIDFLDPFISALKCSNIFSMTNLYNYARFYIGCVQILYLVRSKRRIGIILIKLSRLFIYNKNYHIGYNISCIAYQWYACIYNESNDSKLQKIIQSLTLFIEYLFGECALHHQCGFCNISNKPSFYIGDFYTFDKELAINLENLDNFISNKQFLNNNYLQYLSIYKHDLTLNYSGLISCESLSSFQTTENKHTCRDLMMHLKPFVNNFVSYGVHSLLQAYRKLYLNRINSQFINTSPSRYELLTLITMIESSMSIGCTCRSIATLLLMLDKIVYFPPIYEFEALKTIQSKFVDSLSILSSGIQLPTLRAPYYSVKSSNNRGFTSINSSDIISSNSLKNAAHILLLFDISFETPPLNLECNSCVKYDHLAYNFNRDINEVCANCEGKTISVHKSHWITCKISKPACFFETGIINGPDNKWIPLKESQNMTLPIVSDSRLIDKSNLFLYDPFEKRITQDEYELLNKSRNISEIQTKVLWQIEKQYTVNVSLFNPFIIPIVLDCFSLIIDGNVECIISPVSVVIPPTPRFSAPVEVKVAVNITPKNPGFFSIIGVTYKFSGIIFVNYGMKSTLLNNNSSFAPYLNIFVIPKISINYSISWEESINQESRDSKNNKIKARINIRKKLNETNYFKLLSTNVYIEESNNAKNYMIDEILINDSESSITIDCTEPCEINQFKLKFKSWVKFEEKIFIFLSKLEMYSNNLPLPKIVNISLIPKLNYKPVKYEFKKSKWKVDEAWIIITLENNSRNYPIELIIGSNITKDRRVMLHSDKKTYRWGV
ncbi:large low complexity protein, potential zinc ribbon [Cryptosporidium felis]|nr:large low complexity protein, potential zinc ribbon [Cryptosporidium felis]